MERAYWTSKNEVVKVVNVHGTMVLIVARDGAHMVDKARLIFSSNSEVN